MNGDIAYIQVRAGFVGTAIDLVHSFHYIMADGTGAPDLAGFIGNFIPLVLTPARAILTTDWIGKNILTTIIFGPSRGMQYEDFSINAITGTRGVPSAPFTTSFLFHRTAPLATRKSRGRLFLAPCAAADYNLDGSLVAPPAGTGAFEAAAIATLTDGPGNVYTPCLVTVDPVAPQTRTISDYSLADRCGVRRHRRVLV